MPPSAPTSPRFTWRARHEPIPTPNVPFNPSIEEAREVFLEIADRWLSPAMVAARHGTTLSAFLAWLADPANFKSVPEPTFNLPPTVEDLHYDHEHSDDMIARYRTGEPIADIAKDYGLPTEEITAYLAHPRTQIQMNAQRDLEDTQDIDLFKSCRRNAARKLAEILENPKDEEVARKAATALFRFSNNALNPPSPRSPHSPRSPERGPDAPHPGDRAAPLSMSPDRQGGGTAPNQPPRPPAPSHNPPASSLPIPPPPGGTALRAVSSPQVHSQTTAPFPVAMPLPQAAPTKCGGCSSKAPTTTRPSDLTSAAGAAIPAGVAPKPASPAPASSRPPSTDLSLPVLSPRPAAPPISRTPQNGADTS